MSKEIKNQYRLTIFEKSSLPKEIDNNHYWLAEEKGAIPYVKDLAVSKTVFEGIQYSPETEIFEFFKTKYTTDEDIEVSFKNGYLPEASYKRLVALKELHTEDRKIEEYTDEELVELFSSTIRDHAKEVRFDTSLLPGEKEKQVTRRFNLMLFIGYIEQWHDELKTLKFWRFRRIKKVKQLIVNYSKVLVDLHNQIEKYISHKETLK